MSASSNDSVAATRPAAANAPGLGRSWLASSIGIFASRISGLARDVTSAWYWGATGICQAAYSIAFAVPNSLRQLFSEGAFTAAFVPMLSERIATEKREEAWQLAHRAITVQALAVTAVAALFAACSCGLYLSGRFAQNETTQLTLYILPMLMPFAVLICSAGAFSAVLNSLKSFLLPSSVQIVFNLVQVVSIFLLAWCGLHNDDLRALYLFCGATLLGGALELIILALAARRRGYRFRFIPDWRAPVVKELCLRILPGVIGAGVMQINSLIDKCFSLYLGSAAIGGLNYSHRLVYLPIGIFAVAMGNAALPALSRAQAKGDQAAVASSFTYAMRTILFFALPCTFFLATSGRDVISLLFARGAFNKVAIQETYWALCFYLVGMPAFCLAKVVTTPFHARKDTKTPMLVSVACLLLNIVLNALLMFPLRQGGLALATSICSWLNIIILLAINRRHLPQWSCWNAIREAFPLLELAVIAAIITDFTMQYLPAFLPTWGVFLAYLLQVVIALTITCVIYLGGCLLLKRPELRDLTAIFRRRRA